MAILVTGGAGYIGSHTCVQLLAAGHELVVLDNLCNANPESLKRVERISERSFSFIEGDIRDRECLDRIFAAHKIEAVIHFAGLKAVGESCQQPLHYYHNNVAGSLVLFEAMAAAKVKTLVFSSSATVYGDPASVPIQEAFPTSATNPYGRSKLIIEEILGDLYAADSEWRIARLRYFNPIGAHASGLIGEDPNGIPSNLLPYIAQVAIGKLKQLSVFGGDYPTPDGTGVRDYIHVVDLAEGHLKALQALSDRGGMITCNLGTGQGYSVLEMIKALEQASGRPVPYQIAERRPGDIAVCYADPRSAEQLLGWSAQRDLQQMMIDTWHWQTLNPQGYA
ncbi:MAG: UDP-glucose 4-epimerase [Motiliproteus sp.]|jgi:UDP-glucose 4-epimerase